MGNAPSKNDKQQFEETEFDLYDFENPKESFPSVWWLRQRREGSVQFTDDQGRLYVSPPGKNRAAAWIRNKVKPIDEKRLKERFENKTIWSSVYWVTFFWVTWDKPEAEKSDVPLAPIWASVDGKIKTQTKRTSVATRPDEEHNADVREPETQTWRILEFHTFRPSEGRNITWIVAELTEGSISAAFKENQ